MYETILDNTNLTSHLLKKVVNYMKINCDLKIYSPCWDFKFIIITGIT